MKKPNTIQKASLQIPGFLELHDRLIQSITISGKSKSMCYNYALHLAKVALRFGCVPTAVPVSQIKQYLYEIKCNYPSASEAYFKFTVFSLRYAYRMEGLMDKHVEMPSIKREKRLPVVLSKSEMKKLLETPKWQKHRLLLALLYGCGLRCMEVRNIKISDIDFDRKMLHVRQGKGKKDRYVPLAQILVEQLHTYIAKTRSVEWLFQGKALGYLGNGFDNRYSTRGIHWIIKQVTKKAGIHKRVSVHTLRHTFATHLLEDGLDILSIKELLGHVRIETTMIYLHVAQIDKPRVFSPLDSLYGFRTAIMGNTAMPLQMMCPAIRLFAKKEAEMLECY